MAGSDIEVVVPDLGDVDGVIVAELLVAAGETVETEQSLVTLESDKASMEVPSPAAGRVRTLHVEAGATVRAGDRLLTLSGAGGEDPEASTEPSTPETEARPEADGTATTTAAAPQADSPEPASGEVSAAESRTGSPPYATPSIRKLARERGIDLRGVAGSGRKGRILRADLERLAPGTGEGSHVAGPTTPAGLPAMPAIDFAQFGEIESVALSRINKLTGQNLHRSWLHVPHVTQFDDADITELEAFRKSAQADAERQGVKLTFVSFLLAAVAAALREMPRFNSSLAPDGQTLILKKYINIGVAVDTPAGLVVPVIRDVSGKRVLELAAELAEASERARAGKLTMRDIQGGTFTLSSLGGIGGTAFTPIVNAPEVAILGVSRASMQPVWHDDAFVPRLLLPLSLSYDHRVIDGAAAARFTRLLARLLGDIRTLLL